MLLHGFEQVVPVGKLGRIQDLSTANRWSTASRRPSLQATRRQRMLLACLLRLLIKRCPTLTNTARTAHRYGNMGSSLRAWICSNSHRCPNAAEPCPSWLHRLTGRGTWAAACAPPEFAQTRIAAPPRAPPAPASAFLLSSPPPPAGGDKEHGAGWPVEPKQWWGAVAPAHSSFSFSSACARHRQEPRQCKAHRSTRQPGTCCPTQSPVQPARAPDRPQHSAASTSPVPARYWCKQSLTPHRIAHA